MLPILPRAASKASFFCGSIFGRAAEISFRIASSCSAYSFSSALPCSVSTGFSDLFASREETAGKLVKNCQESKQQTNGRLHWVISLEFLFFSFTLLSYFLRIKLNYLFSEALAKFWVILFREVYAVFGFAEIVRVYPFTMVGILREFDLHVAHGLPVWVAHMGVVDAADHKGDVFSIPSLFSFAPTTSESSFRRQDPILASRPTRLASRRR